MDIRTAIQATQQRLNDIKSSLHMMEDEGSPTQRKLDEITRKRLIFEEAYLSALVQTYVWS